MRSSPVSRIFGLSGCRIGTPEIPASRIPIAWFSTQKITKRPTKISNFSPNLAIPNCQKEWNFRKSHLGFFQDSNIYQNTTTNLWHWKDAKQESKHILNWVSKSRYARHESVSGYDPISRNRENSWSITFLSTEKDIHPHQFLIKCGNARNVLICYS